MYDIYYLNSMGVRIDLTKGNYRLQTGDIFDFEMDYTTYGSKVKRFSMSMCVKELLIGIVAASEVEFAKAVNHFHDATGYDVANKMPGRLYVWNYYIDCYLISSKKEEWENGIECIDNSVEMLVPRPYWTREILHKFKASQITSSNNKKYPYRYPYRYANGLIDASVTNQHYDECNILLRIYGPVVSPIIYIGGNRYWVNTRLEEGERLEIDTRDKSVIKIMTTGIRVSEFDSREKEKEPFFKLSPGKNQVSTSGKFDYDIVQFVERREPEWPY